MRLLISNPSIVVALEQVGFLDLLFNLPIEINVTEFLYERELEGCIGQRLLQLGLQIRPLGSEMTTLATKSRRQFPTLCLDEGYAFALALKSSFELLTISPELSRLAEIEKVSYRSLIWFFDLVMHNRTIAQDSLCQGILTIAETTRCHLLKKEAVAWLSHSSSLLNNNDELQ